MKTENTQPQTRRHLTDADRNSCLKLLTCGLSTDEIVDIMHISRSTVSNIRQAHTACLNKDWSVLQRLSTESRATVDWAMQVTGAEKDFQEIFNSAKITVAPDAVNEPVDFQFKIYDTLLDIRNLLADIYNKLI